MKRQTGLSLIGVLLLIGTLILTAGGVVVWRKKIVPPPSIQRVTPILSPIPTTSYEITPVPTPSSTKIIGPTVGGPVSPGVFEGDLRQLPTSKPFPTEYMRPISDVVCQTVKDCYDNDGVTLKGICSSPCVLACINNRCANTTPSGVICLAKNTLIDTPSGQIPVQNLRQGMKIWTIDAKGEREAVSILKTVKALTPNNHQIVHFLLKDGRELFASPEHPTASGQKLGNLSPGDVLDGSRIAKMQFIPYQEIFTYDILPKGETGFYWANGILLKSTLAD